MGVSHVGRRLCPRWHITGGCSQAAAPTNHPQQQESAAFFPGSVEVRSPQQRHAVTSPTTATDRSTMHICATRAIMLLAVLICTIVL
jgi:hypothetical protein